MALTHAYATLLVNNGSAGTRTIVGTSPLTATENNLANWLVRMEIINTGVSKTNSGTLTLRIDALGTFIRSGPILVDQNTKNNYLIELQLKQDLDNDGDTNDANEQGQVLRGIIGQPQISVDESYGEVLRINVVGIEYRLKEAYTSREHLFQSPSESFGNRLIEANNTATGIFIDDINLNLPLSPKLTFTPFNPTKIHDALAEIIDVLALPQTAGGAFQDYYFDFVPDTTGTFTIDVVADEFGREDSGVTLDPLTLDSEGANEEQTVVTDNIEYKNHVIMIGSANSGSLPMERTRFASKFEHARIRDAWDGNGASYSAGDLVKFTTSTAYEPHLTTYHRALVDHVSAPALTPLTVGQILWEIDFSDIAPFATSSGAYYRQGEIVTVTAAGTVSFYQCNTSGTYTTVPPAAPWTLIATTPSAKYTPFVSYTPWTNNTRLWRETMCARTLAEAGGDHGWAFDWNVTKANYKRADMTNSFEPITAKWVTDYTRTSPPTGIERYDGNRFLIAPSATGAWSGMDGRIAEWDFDHWEFSKAPAEGDVVNDLNMASILRYSGGSWVPLWEPTNVDDNDKPSPFHLCKNVGLCAGATGISAQAVEFTYDWVVGIGTEKYRTSRGVWISQSFPLPRKDTTSFTTGSLYGGDGVSAPLLGTFNTNNMDYTRKGELGWNLGIDVEDMGKITAIVFKLRVGLFKDTSGSSVVEGQSNIPLTFWCADKFDRIWYSKFKVRRNGQWDDIRIPVGSMAPTSLYFARWDELAKLNGVVLTFLDFTLAEKEYSGVQFDWKFVKHWGIQLDESYVDTGLYKNGTERATSFGNDIVADVAANWYWYLSGAIGLAIREHLPDHTPVTQNFVRLSGKIALDDLHFEKELIVTSDDTPKVDPRTTLEFLPTESDYENLKVRATGSEARKRFFPQFWHIRATGDVRLKFGKLFTVAGSRVPAGSQTMIASEVKHIYGHDGYHVEVAGVRKFTTSG